MNTFTYKKTISGLISATVIVLPLFFLPWGLNAVGMDNADKYLVLSFFVAAILGFYLFSFLVSTPQTFALSLFAIFSFIFLLVLAVNSVLALDSFSAFFGEHGRTALPFYGLFAVVVFSLVLTQSLNKYADIDRLWKLMTAALAVVLFFGIVLVGGVYTGAGNSMGFISRFTEAFGSLEDISLLASIFIVFISGLLICDPESSRIAPKERSFYRAFLVLAVVLLIFAGFVPAWWALLAGLVPIILIAALAGRQNKATMAAAVRFRWYYVLVMVALFYVVASYSFYDSSLLDRRYMSNLHSNPEAGAKVAFQSVKERPFFGFGLDNYQYGFSAFRPADLNYTQYWDARFSRGASQYGEFLTTIGAAGLLSYLCLLGLMVYYTVIAAKSIILGENIFSGREGIVLALSGCLWSLAVLQFFFVLNALFMFLLFLLMGLLCAELRLNGLGAVWGKEISISRVSRSGVYEVAASGLLLLFLVAAGFSLFGAKHRYVSARYESAGSDSTKLQQVIRMNPYRYEYQQELSKAQSRRFQEAGRKPELNRLANSALASARQAVNMAPYSVATHETLGFVYRSIAGIAPDSNLEAARAFAKAFEIEPTNPVLSAEAGHAYYESGQYDKAEKYYSKSIILKSDYYPARIGIAKTYMQSGKTEAARKLLNKLAEEYIRTEIYYERGKLYFNSKRLDKAKEDFQRVIAISPNNANALYSLGLVHEKADETREALHYFNKVSDLDPGNERVMKKIEEMER